MLLDPHARLLHGARSDRTSCSTRRRSCAMLSADDQTRVLRGVAAARRTRARGVTVRRARRFAAAVRRRSTRNVAVGPNISRVVAALPTNVAELPPQLLVGTMIVLAPIIFVVSIARRVLRRRQRVPSGRAADQRSRGDHRRPKPAPPAAGRLEQRRARRGSASTVNAMLARLETSFAALRRFTADASHELKTPLTVLRADVERAMHPATQPRASAWWRSRRRCRRRRACRISSTACSRSRAPTRAGSTSHRAAGRARAARARGLRDRGHPRRGRGAHALDADARGRRRDGRSHAAAPAVAQPRHERDQVHAARRTRRAVA